MTGNTKTMTGHTQKNVYTLIRESEYKNLLKELPDLFHNPNVIVRVVDDSSFLDMVEQMKEGEKI